MARLTKAGSRRGEIAALVLAAVILVGGVVAYLVVPTDHEPERTAPAPAVAGGAPATSDGTG
jgi:hypothetical protein